LLLVSFNEHFHKTGIAVLILGLKLHDVEKFQNISEQKSQNLRFEKMFKRRAQIQWCQYLAEDRVDNRNKSNNSNASQLALASSE